MTSHFRVSNIPFVLETMTSYAAVTVPLMFYVTSSSITVLPAKGSYGAEGQLHTVIEKSPESSPTTKPRQGGGVPQPSSPTGPCSGPPDSGPHSGRLILPAGVNPVPRLEPHYAQVAGARQGPSSSAAHRAPADGGREEGAAERRRDGRMPADENGYQDNISLHPCSASTQLRPPGLQADR